jgi:hypothetical protein
LIVGLYLIGVMLLTSLVNVASSSSFLATKL